MVAITSQNHSIDSSSVPRQAECPGKEHRPGPQRGHCIKMIHRLVYLMLEPICRTQEIGSSPQVPVNMKKGWNKHLTGEFIDIHRLFIRSHQNARYRFCSSHYGLCCKQHGFHNATWNPHPSNKTSATFDPNCVLECDAEAASNSWHNWNPRCSVCHVSESSRHFFL